MALFHYILELNLDPLCVSCFVSKLLLCFVGIEIAVIFMKSVGLMGIGWCIRDVFIIIAVPPCIIWIARVIASLVFSMYKWVRWSALLEFYKTMRVVVGWAWSIPKGWRRAKKLDSWEMMDISCVMACWIWRTRWEREEIKSGGRTGVDW